MLFTRLYGLARRMLHKSVMTLLINATVMFVVGLTARHCLPSGLLAISGEALSLLYSTDLKANMLTSTTLMW